MLSGDQAKRDYYSESENCNLFREAPTFCRLVPPAVSQTTLLADNQAIQITEIAEKLFLFSTVTGVTDLSFFVLSQVG